MVLISRIVSALILGIAGYQLGHSSGLEDRLPGYGDIALNFGLLILLGAIVGWFIGGILGKLLLRGFARFNTRAADRSGPELVVGTVGIIVGLGVSALLAIPLSQLDPVGSYLMLPVTLIIAYAAAEVAANNHRDILRLFGVHPDGDEDEAHVRAKLLDTSALIDGRVADVAAAGFLEGELVVSVFVLEELQAIADSNDEGRRARGRRGLEMVTRLRRAKRVTTTDEDPAPGAPVDARLVRLAAAHGWAIVTNDVNLAKLAEAQELTVLNVNRLANALKVDLVPGERFELKLVREGKEAGQGVGYLDDGTMVVVEAASDQLGSTVEVEVSSMLQSPTGKLVFTKLAEDA